jgi:hypothetical protein
VRFLAANGIGQFEGFEVVDPGLVPIPAWRPGPPDDAPSDSGDFWGGLAGVARKP